MEKFKSCGLCINGHIVREGVPYFCNCKKSYDRKTELLLRLDKSKIPHDIQLYSYSPSSDYRGNKSRSSVDKIEKFIQGFRTKYSKVCLYLYGPDGTQKTILASYIGRKLLEENYQVGYVQMSDLLQILSKSGFDKDSDTTILKYDQLNCLIIDNCFDEGILFYKSVDKMDYRVVHLREFLRRSLKGKNKKSVIFISQESPNKIAELGYGKDIEILIKESTRNTQLFFQDFYEEPGALWDI
jgi:hypothetical protein